MHKKLIALFLLPFATVHAEIRTDGSLGPALELAGPDFEISADLGRQHGDNLFHSFDAFHIRLGESATFTGPHTLRHVISRVTGGEASEINGPLRSTLPAADIYLLNPAGVMFGPRAALDVAGGFHVSSGDAVKLADGNEFHADPSHDSQLSVAAPAAFGFLDHPHGAITMTGTGQVLTVREPGLHVAEGEGLTLAGGDISLQDGAYIRELLPDRYPDLRPLGSLTAPGGTIQLAAVDGAGEVPLKPSAVGSGTGGDIHLGHKIMLGVSGGSSGSIYIRGGTFSTDNALIEAVTTGGGSGGVIDIQADTVSLRNGTYVDASTFAEGQGSNIRIRATDTILLQGENAETGHADKYFNNTGLSARSGIFQEVTHDNLGDAGSIELEATDIRLEDGAALFAGSDGGGRGGDVTIRAHNRVLVRGKGSEGDNSGIFTTAFGESAQAGDAGNLHVQAREIRFQERGGLFSQTFGAARGGNIRLEADNIHFTHGFILADTLGSGQSGNISLDVTKNINFEQSSIYARTQGSGKGGTLDMSAENIRFIKGALAMANTLGGGNAGDVTLRAAEDILFSGLNNPEEFTEVDMSGLEGVFDPVAEFLMSIGKGGLYAEVREGAAGNGGNVLLEGDNVTLMHGAGLGAATYSSGNAGNLRVRARDTLWAGGTDLGGGVPGLFGYSYANKSGQKAGKAGNISVEAGHLHFEQGALIVGNSIALHGGHSGDGANIDVDVAGETRLTGVNPFGEYDFGFASGIYAKVKGHGSNTGKGGNIHLRTGSLVLEDGGRIEASTNSRLPAGNITVEVAGEARISGDASEIPLRHDGIAHNNYLATFLPSTYNQSVSGIYADSQSTDPLGGESGTIDLQADSVVLSDHGTLSTATAGGKPAGDIVLRTRRLEMDDSARIVSASTLRNRYQVADMTERDHEFLLYGDMVDVVDTGDGRTARYVNIGLNTLRIQPVYSVADQAELETLTRRFHLRGGDIITVADAGDGKPARFVYAQERNLPPWTRIIDERPAQNFDSPDRVDITRSFHIDYAYLPGHRTGTRVRIDNAAGDRLVEYVLVGAEGNPVKALQRINRFDLQHPGQLQYLAGQSLLDGDVALAGGRRFVYSRGVWEPLGRVTHTAGSLQDKALIILPENSTLVDVGDPDGEDKQTFVYSGAEWLTSTNLYVVSNLAARDALPAQTGDVAKVADGGNGERANFYYAHGEWHPQVRGGDAGNIRIEVSEDIRLSGDCAISTEAASAGGGKLFVNVTGLTELNQSEISSTVQEGYGHGGDLGLNTLFLVQDRSPVIARAYEGDGGGIQIITTGIYPFQPHGQSPIDASSQFGVDGVVEIHAPDTDISSGLIVLSTEFNRADDLRRSACDAESAAQASQFVHKQREGVPSRGRGDFLAD